MRRKRGIREESNKLRRGSFGAVFSALRRRSHPNYRSFEGELALLYFDGTPVLKFSEHGFSNFLGSNPGILVGKISGYRERNSGIFCTSGVSSRRPSRSPALLKVDRIFQCVKKITERTRTPVMCLIRCRAGDFHYNDEEIEVMVEDIRSLKQNGADGFVIGERCGSLGLSMT